MPDTFIDRDENRFFSRRNLTRTLVGLGILMILTVILALIGWYAFRGSVPDVVAPRDWYHRPLGFLLDAVCGASVAGGAAMLLSFIFAVSFVIGTTVIEKLGFDDDR